MRAIITCSCDIADEVLQEVLNGIDWWPRLDQDNETVKERKTEILTHITDDHKAVAEGTFLCVIYDEETKSWGIVSRPTRQSITFRIKNEVSDRLKRACEVIVKKLQGLKAVKYKDKDVPVHFRFEQKVQVLERESVNYAFYGEVLSPKKWQRVTEEKGNEMLLIYWSLAIGFILLFLTTPWFYHLVEALIPTLDKDWRQGEWVIFYNGFCDRVSSSAFVTVVVTGLNVYFQYLNVRKLSNIKWMLN